MSAEFFALAFLAALHNLVTGKPSTVTQVIAVGVLIIMNFALIIIAFAFLELSSGPRPSSSCSSDQDWLTGHAPQLIATIAVLLGANVAISGLVPSELTGV
jgi:hypothetical protein